MPQRPFRVLCYQSPHADFERQEHGEPNDTGGDDRSERGARPERRPQRHAIVQRECNSADRDGRPEGHRKDGVGEQDLARCKGSQGIVASGECADAPQARYGEIPKPENGTDDVQRLQPEHRLGALGGAPVKSAIVVGAGFAGLAAALELARAGVAVTVFEAADRAGGRAQQLVSPDGRFRFDMGPTVIVMIDALRNVLGDAAFAELGLRRLEPGYRVLWPDGGRFDMHSDVALWLAELAGYQGSAGAPRALDYLARVHEAHVESRRRILEVDLGPAAAARLLLRPGKLRPWAVDNLRRFTQRYFTHPRIVDALTFQTLYLGMSPRQSPAIYALLATEEIVGGVWYADGGTAAIVAAFVRACERQAIRFHYSTPVTRIVIDSAKEVHVIAGGGVHRADAVVVAADREPALERLFGTPSQRAGPRYGHSAIVYYLGLEGDVDLPHHSVHLPANPWKSYAELDAARVPVEPLVYVCNPAPSDPPAAAGTSALVVLAPVPNRRALPAFDEEALYGRVLQTIERHAGALRNRIVFRAQRGPREFESELGLAHGAAFGPSHALTQMGPLRPPIAYRGAAHVAFAGSGTRPGSGVPLVLISGRLAAQHVLKALA